MPSTDILKHLNAVVVGISDVDTIVAVNPQAGG